jgi:F-type H+-transporting ATPase subunit gamma
VTRAMKIVAAARLRKAQDRILATRPYAQQMRSVLSSVAQHTDPREHALLQVREIKNVELVLITGDKGLCGPFNTNVLKQTMQFIGEHEKGSFSIQTIGKKGRDFLKRRDVDIFKAHLDIGKGVQYSHASDIAGNITERFIDGKLDAVYLLYNEFKSILQQKVVLEKLLPIREIDAVGEPPEQDYVYEPEPRVLLNHLLPKHVEYQILRALLESVAAEFAARMTAMDSATRNAGDLIQSLTRTMNRVRQAGITREIIEVVSGAQAQQF